MAPPPASPPSDAPSAACVDTDGMVDTRVEYGKGCKKFSNNADSCDGAIASLVDSMLSTFQFCSYNATEAKCRPDDAVYEHCSPPPACLLAAGLADTQVEHGKGCKHFHGDEEGCEDAIASVEEDMSTFQVCYYNATKAKCKEQVQGRAGAGRGRAQPQRTVQAPRA